MLFGPREMLATIALVVQRLLDELAKEKSGPSDVPTSSTQRRLNTNHVAKLGADLGGGPSLSILD